MYIYEDETSISLDQQAGGTITKNGPGAHEGPAHKGRAHKGPGKAEQGPAMRAQGGP